ncbi:MAG: hypothetical protein EYC68_06375 [Chloroflexota bacterium]|nr:MAG: hypothetical protein EYC68_06375 [Chloroflexota bacterium]
MNHTPKAFIVMSFDQEFKSIYEQLITPALEGAGYRVSRADSSLDQQNILRDIVRNIAEAKLVVAEITVQNPNVYYELGLCHALGIPTVLIAQSMEKVPFDLRSYRVLTYSTQFDEVNKLKEALLEIGIANLKGTITFGSPVTDFLSNERINQPREVATLIAAPQSSLVSELDDRNELGILDFLVEGNEIATDLAGIMQRIGEQIVEFNGKLNKNTDLINSLPKDGSPGVAARAREIAAGYAKDMETLSAFIDSEISGYDKSIDALVEVFSGYMSWLTVRGQEALTELQNSRNSMKDLLESTRKGLLGTRAFRESISSTRGISGDVSRSGRHLGKSLDRLISSMERIESFSLKTFTSMDEQLNQSGDPTSG